MFDSDNQSYYDVLDIKPDATQAEIRNAYFRVKSAYSRDSAALYSIFDEQETQLVLEKIEQAYLVLSSNEKRKEYDKLHGFLQHGVSTPEKAMAPQTSTNTFSFGSKEADSAAEDAAHNVFGSGSNFPENEVPTQKPQPTQAPQPNRFADTDYSTPRTLQEGSAYSARTSGSIATETTDSFKPYENKLGIVRRIDLIKSNADSNIETLVTEETDFRGEFLKKIREIRGISIDELAEFTKISKHYLNCLESEEYENLPAAVYVRGFVSQVAKALKIPADKAAQSYMNHYKQAFTK